MADKIESSAPDEKSTVLKKAQDFWTSIRNSKPETEYRETSIRDLDFFTGKDQGWDAHGDRTKLESEGRPAITLNREAPIMRLICGARPKVEITFLAGNDVGTDTAPIINSLYDHIDNWNKWEYVEDDWFKLGAILSRSVILLLPNYKRDIRGEVEKILKDGHQFYFGKSNRKDRKDMQEYIMVENVSKEEAMRMFPKKKKDIKAFAEYVENQSPTKARDVDPVDRYKDPQAEGYYNPDTHDISLIYYWYKEYDTAIKLIDKATGKVHDSPVKSKEEAESQLEEIGGMERFEVFEQEVCRVKYLIFCQNIELEQGLTPWERKDGKRTDLSDNFNIVVFEPERIIAGLRNELVNIMAAWHDPQEYHNKLASSVLAIINSTAKSGYDYEKGAITDVNLKKLKKDGSKPGAMIEWEHMDKMKPRKGEAMPTAEIAVAEKMSAELLNVSGVESLVNTESLGKRASGKAIGFKMQQGGNIISWLYYSFSFFVDQLARYSVDAAQCLYDYEKIIRVKGNKKKQVTINEKAYDLNGNVAKVLNDVTIADCDLVISEKDDLPTLRLERLKYFSELVKSGELQLPPPVLMKIVMSLMDDPELRDMIEEELGVWIEEQKVMAQQQAAAGQGRPVMPAGRTA